MLDVAYRIVDSPVGSLLLAATETGLVRVAYASEDHDRVLEDLSSHISPRILRHPARLDAAARELDEYFAGRRKSFGLSLDRRLSTGFRATVLRHLGDIAYGRTASYAKVAELAGRPKAARASGPRAPPTPSRSWCPATASCGRTAAWAGISEGSTRRRRCSSSRPRGEDRAAGR